MIQRSQALTPKPPAQTHTSIGMYFRSGSLAGEQWLQFAGAVEHDQIVVAADVNAADINLRHRAPAGLLHHFHAARGLEINAHLGDIGHTLGAEQLFRPDAIGTDGSRVHHYFGHRRAHQTPPTLAASLTKAAAALPPKGVQFHTASL